VEELAAASPAPLCDLCRCAGESGSLSSRIWAQQRAFLSFVGIRMLDGRDG
jgi:hypothetical protein